MGGELGEQGMGIPRINWQPNTRAGPSPSTPLKDSSTLMSTL